MPAVQITWQDGDVGIRDRVEDFVPPARFARLRAQ